MCRNLESRTNWLDFFIEVGKYVLWFLCIFNFYALDYIILGLPNYLKIFVRFFKAYTYEMSSSHIEFYLDIDMLKQITLMKIFKYQIIDEPSHQLLFQIYLINNKFFRNHLSWIRLQFSSYYSFSVGLQKPQKSNVLSMILI